MLNNNESHSNTFVRALKGTLNFLHLRTPSNKTEFSDSILSVLNPVLIAIEQENQAVHQKLLTQSELLAKIDLEKTTQKDINDLKGILEQLSDAQSKKNALTLAHLDELKNKHLPAFTASLKSDLSEQFVQHQNQLVLLKQQLSTLSTKDHVQELKTKINQLYLSQQEFDNKFKTFGDSFASNHKEYHKKLDDLSVSVAQLGKIIVDSNVDIKEKILASEQRNNDRLTNKFEEVNLKLDAVNNALVAIQEMEQRIIGRLNNQETQLNTIEDKQNQTNRQIRSLIDAFRNANMRYVENVDELPQGTKQAKLDTNHTAFFKDNLGQIELYVARGGERCISTGQYERVLGAKEAYQLLNKQFQNLENTYAHLKQHLNQVPSSNHVKNNFFTQEHQFSFTIPQQHSLRA
jgi:hypothetical protein